MNNVKIQDELDTLCDNMVNTTIEYDEREELKRAFKKKMININRTIERYNRYIKGITLWEINEVSYEYIHVLILEFLSTKNVLLSKQIDNNLLKMLNEI